MQKMASYSLAAIFHSVITGQRRMKTKPFSVILKTAFASLSNLFAV
jgi:hypothetical protein